MFILHEIVPLVGIVFTFSFLTAIILVPIWLRSRERARMQDTLRAAIDRGQPLPTEVIDAMTSGMKTPPSRTRDFRRAVIWLAIAGAFATFGLLEQAKSGWGDANDWYGIAAIPGFVGLAFLLLGLLNSKRG